MHLKTRNTIFQTQLPILGILFSLIGFIAMISMNENKRAILHICRMFLFMTISLYTKKIRTKTLFEISTILYIVSLLLLISTFILSAKHAGTYRWLNLFFMKIQVSDCMKISLILFLSKFLHSSNSSFINYCKAIMIICIPTLIILKQPDLGTAILICAIGITMIFFHNIKWFSYTTLAGLSTLPFVWKFLHQYQKNRIIAFLNPSLYIKGIGYHAQQSLISIGSGGLYGKGIGQGTQSNFGFLPEKHTDFILAHIGEEFGFWGIMLVIFLFTYTTIYIIYLISQIDIKFYRLVCFGVANYIFFQAYINIAMTVGFCPVVGIALPFISYGGSSLLALWTCIGIVENIFYHKQATIINSKLYQKL